MPLIDLVYRRGHLHFSDSRTTAVYFFWFSLSLAFWAAQGLYARAFYAAYRRFAALLREPRFQMKIRLATGDLVAFDNQRILHGRTGFSSAKHPRHLRGCYLTRDSVYCETALLRRKLDPTARI